MISQNGALLSPGLSWTIQAKECGEQEYKANSHRDQTHNLSAVGIQLTCFFAVRTK